MDKELKQKLKNQFKANETAALVESLPLSIDNLKELLSFLGRESATGCDHSLRKTFHFIKSRNLDQELITTWLGKQGGYCDCEVLANVYDSVGDIVGWHLDEG